MRRLILLAGVAGITIGALVASVFFLFFAPSHLAVRAEHVPAETTIAHAADDISLKPSASLTTPISIPVSFHATPFQHHSQYYPWKNEVNAALFSIGDEPPDAIWHGDGARDVTDENDPAYNMSGYAPSDGASTRGPFYVALPFDDLAHPDEALKWVPAAWAEKSEDPKTISACQHRWVEIKNRSGRVCFAQWEVAGPASADDPGYIFGTDKPKAIDDIGLRISPAVGKYLGIDPKAVVSWRFVDDEDVHPGMWLRYDEQALLFKAMQDQKAAPGK